MTLLLFAFVGPNYTGTAMADEFYFDTVSYEWDLEWFEEGGSCKGGEKYEGKFKSGVLQEVKHCREAKYTPDKSGVTCWKFGFDQGDACPSRATFFTASGGRAEDLHGVQGYDYGFVSQCLVGEVTPLRYDEESGEYVRAETTEGYDRIVLTYRSTGEPWQALFYAGKKLLYDVDR